MVSVSPLVVVSRPLRVRDALRVLGREASALLDALTSPVQFVAEVEAQHPRPGRGRQV